MKIDNLVDQLTENLQPVRPVMSPGRFALVFSIFCLVAGTIAVAALHARSDVGFKLENPVFLAELFLYFALMIATLFWIGRLSVPGLAKSSNLRSGVASLVAATAILELTRVFGIDGAETVAGLDLSGAACFIAVMAVAFFPSAALTLALKRRAPVHLRQVGLLTALAGLGAGQLVITLHCPSDNPIHILLWHLLLPVCSGVTLGTLVGSKLIRW